MLFTINALIGQKASPQPALPTETMIAGALTSLFEATHRSRLEKNADFQRLSSKSKVAKRFFFQLRSLKKSDSFPQGYVGPFVLVTKISSRDYLSFEYVVEFTKVVRLVLTMRPSHVWIISANGEEFLIEFPEYPDNAHLGLWT